MNLLDSMLELRIGVFQRLSIRKKKNSHFFQEWVFIESIRNSPRKLVVIQVPEIESKESFTDYTTTISSTNNDNIVQWCIYPATSENRKKKMHFMRFQLKYECLHRDASFVVQLRQAVNFSKMNLHFPQQ